MCTNLQQSQTGECSNPPTKTINRGGRMGWGINVDTHTHSTDWLLHIQGVEGLWITVQVKIRQQIKQTVHTSFHNNQYIFMPVLNARDLTQLDGFKQYGLITSTEGTAVKSTAKHDSVTILSCQTHGGVMEVGENLVLAALMWNEWDGVWYRHLFCR